MNVNKAISRVARLESLLEQLDEALLDLGGELPDSITDNHAGFTAQLARSIKTAQDACDQGRRTLEYISKRTTRRK